MKLEQWIDGNCCKPIKGICALDEEFITRNGIWVRIQDGNETDYEKVTLSVRDDRAINHFKRFYPNQFKEIGGITVFHGVDFILASAFVDKCGGI